MKTDNHTNLNVNNTDVTVIVGAQWGDEGKGKWIDILSKSSDMTVRFQGGNNAGHTIYVDGKKYVLHQIPSSIFHKGCIAAMAAGVVVHPQSLVTEITNLAGIVEVNSKNLWISPRAHVITPWHVFLDGRNEDQSDNAIGTTKRGIGPTYSEKAARTSLRLGHFINDDLRHAWIRKSSELDPEFKNHVAQNKISWDQFSFSASQIKEFVCDVETKMRHSIYGGKKVLLEGAQGSLLDLDHGTYPYVTSSSTASSGACASLGFSPKAITKILGVAKAYVTRVGAGPFPTELQDSIGVEIAKRGHEFGATTGRPRRCGWFDAVAFRYSQELNGFDGVILNKLDILNGFKELKIATHYIHPKLGKITEFPWDDLVLKDCIPHYEKFLGWQGDIPKTGLIKDLPKEALAFIHAIEHHSHCKISMVGTGPGREEALFES